MATARQQTGEGSVFGAVQKSIAERQVREGHLQYDAEGEVVVTADVRIDALQKQKLREIIELLVMAGYFRARITSLSDFDKVVGGMVWCITASNINVDVDLLFQENSSIGQKISLTERISQTLIDMKCKFDLEPHQIQGLDCIHIFPVIQWLVKRVIETRKLLGDYTRQRATQHYFKSVKPKGSLHSNFDNMLFTNSCNDIRDGFYCRRRYRRNRKEEQAKENNDQKDLATRQEDIQWTLLEYAKFNKLEFLRKSKKRAAAAEAGDEHERSEFEEQGLDISHEITKEERALEDMISSMTAMNAEQHGGSSKDVKRIIETTDCQLRFGSGSRMENRDRVRTMKAKSKALELQLEQIKGKSKDLLLENSSLENDVRKLKKRILKIDQATKALQSSEQSDKIVKENDMKKLVALHESLVEEEMEFRLSCQKEKEEIEAAMEELKSKLNVTEEDKVWMKKVEDQWGIAKTEVEEARSKVAESNREFAKLDRKRDNIPSRSELSQYQKRFFDLYNQMESILGKTKQYYSEYNTLSNTKTYLTKEVSLLESIHDNFEKAMASSQNQQSFMQQFQSIVAGVDNNLKSVNSRNQEQERQLAILHSQYKNLTDAHRHYLEAVQEFEEACSVNEKLHDSLKEYL
eukprot:Nk52_evm42s229 gene=Nk52_evmTU42s229